MKKINLLLSAEVVETAEALAAELGIARNELLSFCLEGSTNPARKLRRLPALNHGREVQPTRGERSGS